MGEESCGRGVRWTRSHVDKEVGNGYEFMLIYYDNLLRSRVRIRPLSHLEDSEDRLGQSMCNTTKSLERT